MNRCQNHPRYALGLVLLVAAQALSACHLPARRTQAPSGASSIYTAAAQTVQAQLTLGSQPIGTPGARTPGSRLTASATPLPTTAIPVHATTPPSPAPVLPSITPSPIPCERVKFVKDVTIPDNTELDPGEVFIKTWRLQNVGSCTWTPAYSLVVEGVNVFNAPLVMPFAQVVVPPGGIIDVSISLTAPPVAGTYRENFKLANASGQRFGLGDGSKPFWAQVQVVAPSGIVFDFIARASQAEWRSGKGNTLDTPLTFGGATDDANGVARINEDVLLETGALSGKILLTFPKHVENGLISGVFPALLVQGGDHLKVRLGFLANPDGRCGAGKVEFRIGYQEGATVNTLGEWVKTCDGKLLPVNIDLSALVGRAVQIIFIVRAEGAFLEDWAIWNSPRIER
jgi:hypothetical protein